MRMVRAYLVEHPRTSLVTQLTNPALHERPLRGRFGSTRAVGPSRDERPAWVELGHSRELQADPVHPTRRSATNVATP